MDIENIFDAIPDQNRVHQLLINFYESKQIPHALLFTGSEGVGKFFTAVQFAKLLNRENPAFEKFENKISLLSEPYIKYVLPLPRGKGEDGNSSPTDKLSQEQLSKMNDRILSKSRNPYSKIVIEEANAIKINSIRDVIKFISYNYDEIEYRIIIIQDAHLMGIEAQNSLLKSLEEPPEGFIFILITDSPQYLLPTIKSRTWEIRFNPLSPDSIASILVNYFDIGADMARKIAPFSNGSVTDAVQLLEFDLDELMASTITVLRYSMARKYNTAFAEISTLQEKTEQDYIKILLNLILSWLSDVVKNRADIYESYFKEYKETVIKFNKKFSEFPVHDLYLRFESLIRLSDKKVNLNIIAMNIIFELASIGIR